MKLDFISQSRMIFYLSHDYLNKINFQMEENIEKEFKKIFIKLKRIFHLDINGYYDVIVYINDKYGMIMEMEKEDDEYIKIFGDTLDMKITFRFDSEFLYRLDNIDFITFHGYKLYYYNHCFFLSLKKNSNISNGEYANLIENSDIVYGEILEQMKNKMVCVF